MREKGTGKREEGAGNADFGLRIAEWGSREGIAVRQAHRRRITDHEFSERSGDPPVAERTTQKRPRQTKPRPRQAQAPQHVADGGAVLPERCREQGATAVSAVCQAGCHGRVGRVLGSVPRPCRPCARNPKHGSQSRGTRAPLPCGPAKAPAPNEATATPNAGPATRCGLRSRPAGTVPRAVPRAGCHGRVGRVPGTRNTAHRAVAHARHCSGAVAHGPWHTAPGLEDQWRMSLGFGFLVEQFDAQAVDLAVLGFEDGDAGAVVDELLSVVRDLAHR